MIKEVLKFKIRLLICIENNYKFEIWTLNHTQARNNLAFKKAKESDNISPTVQMPKLE